MNYYYMQFKTEGNIAHLHFHRLDKLNAINFEMIKEMNHILSNIDTKKLNALFIHGDRKAFSAGGDLKEMQSLEISESEKRIHFIHNTFRLFQKLEIPVVAFVQGICFGGGLELALHCDFRICSSETQFAFPEVKYGMIPGGGGTVLFPKLVSKADAAFYLLTGEAFSSDKALNLNLVQKVILAENFEKEIEIIQDFFDKANRESLVAIKNQLKNKDLNTTDELYFDEGKLFVNLLDKNGKQHIRSQFLK